MLPGNVVRFYGQKQLPTKPLTSSAFSRQDVRKGGVVSRGQGGMGETNHSTRAKEVAAEVVAAVRASQHGESRVSMCTVCVCVCVWAVAVCICV